MAATGEQSAGVLRADQGQLIFEQGFSFSGYERDAVRLNLCNGRFLDISGVSGLDSITDGRAAVFADFDNDGDLDVFLTTIQGQAHLLFRNNVGQSNGYLRILLAGKPDLGRNAYGAVVRVQTSAGVLTKIKSGGMGFLSQHDPRLLFGLGPDERAEWVEVTWPDGSVERFRGEFEEGTTLLLRQGVGKARRLQLARASLPDPLSLAAAFARHLTFGEGDPLPELRLATSAGEELRLRSQLRPGRRTLVNVWATWCAPCAREMPELERLRSHFSAQGIDLIGLNVDTDPAADVEGFLAKTGVQYPNYRGGQQVIEALYRTEELSVPFSLLLDEHGIVLEIIPGWSEETRRRYAALAGFSARVRAPALQLGPARMALLRPRIEGR
ncbi:MAG: redoxin family protein [Terriglobia bacterium]